MGQARRRARGRSRWGRRISLGILVLLLLVIVWAVASWFAFSGGVSDANKRLDQNAKLALSVAGRAGALASDDDPDARHRQRAGRRPRGRHALRLDHAAAHRPSHHRLYYLSIPRDIQVPIPGAGTQKINAAFQIGGPALAIRTIRQFTGLEIDHVMVINFADFKDLIDALGGIDVNVPEPIRSNRFDCPYASQARCDAWPGWRFQKGTQHMSGAAR